MIYRAPLRHGPVIAQVMPLPIAPVPNTLTKKMSPSGLKQAPANSLSLRMLTANSNGSPLRPMPIRRLISAKPGACGYVSFTEKPDVLWDNPGLEGLFVRLEGEFEIRERHTAIERKLNLIASTVHTVLELVSNKHALRVEWYIVILIVFEIFLTLYQLFFL